MSEAAADEAPTAEVPEATGIKKASEENVVTDKGGDEADDTAKGGDDTAKGGDDTAKGGDETDDTATKQASNEDGDTEKKEEETEDSEENFEDAMESEGAGSKNANILGVNVPSLNVPSLNVPSLNVPLLKASKKVDNETPNALHELIRKRDWTNVTVQLESDEALTLVTEWYKKDLPIHMVMQSKKEMAPDDIIAKLVELFPESAKERGKERRIPLQLARKHHASPDVFLILISTYPEGLDEPLDPDKESKHRNKTVRDHDGAWPSMPRDVKNYLERSTYDWKKMLKYEETRREQQVTIGNLQKSVRIARRNIKASKANEKALEVRLEAVKTGFAEYLIASDQQVKELAEKFLALRTEQEEKNDSFKTRLQVSVTHEVANKAAFEGYAKDLLILQQRSDKKFEEHRKNVDTLIEQQKAAGRN